MNSTFVYGININLSNNPMKDNSWTDILYVMFGLRGGMRIFIGETVPGMLFHKELVHCRKLSIDDVYVPIAIFVCLFVCLYLKQNNQIFKKKEKNKVSQDLNPDQGFKVLNANLLHHETKNDPKHCQIRTEELKTYWIHTYHLR